MQDSSDFKFLPAWGLIPCTNAEIPKTKAPAEAGAFSSLNQTYFTLTLPPPSVNR